MTTSTYTLKATNPQGRTMALTFTNLVLMLDAEQKALSMGYTTNTAVETIIIKTEAEALSQLADFLSF